ncbi:MAG: hypothetical protein IAG10_10635 [Planctomycetaceae bacterium]|nr:hypothetical protein [Planctomycetaceae bacterium]
MAREEEARFTWPQCEEPYQSQLIALRDQWVDQAVTDGAAAIKVLRLQTAVRNEASEGISILLRKETHFERIRHEIDVLGDAIASVAKETDMRTETVDSDGRRAAFEVSLGFIRRGFIGTDHPRDKSKDGRSV